MGGKLFNFVCFFFVCVVGLNWKCEIRSNDKNWIIYQYKTSNEICDEITQQKKSKHLSGGYKLYMIKDMDMFIMLLDIVIIVICMKIMRWIL